MLQIKDEFKKLIPPLTAEEFKQLEDNCIAEGIRDAIVTWNGYIIDGHNRYEIAQKYGLEFRVEAMEFEGENEVTEWMILNQFGRRNLSNYQRSVLALQLESVFREKAKEKERIRKTTSHICDESLPEISTKKELGILAKVSHNTIARVKKIEEVATPEVKAKLSTGELTINKAYQEIKKQEKKKEKEEIQKKVDSILNEKGILISDIEKGWHKIGNQYLYFGNNTDKEFIDFVPPCKLAFADPPYNAGVDDWDFNFTWSQDYLQDKAEVVCVTPGGWDAYNFYNICKMNYQWEMACWIKNGMTHGRCGYANWIKIAVFGKGKVRISQDHFSISIKTNETEDTNHKGRKPYEFMAHLIEQFTKVNECIIDPFAGSGTTLIMSEKLNRISYCAELDKQYCLDIINKGIKNGMQYDKF
jgi:16S rRNA G966 N2-methylase RsmD